MSGSRPIVLRTAMPADVPAIFALIAASVGDGHLLPRAISEVRAHAGRFVVACDGRRVVGCAELAPLSARLAEIRSLAVATAARRQGIGTRLVTELRRRAEAAGHEELCAMTHAPGYFASLGFTAVPRLRLQDKVISDCVRCSKFSDCHQSAMVRPLALPADRQDNGDRSPLTITLQVA